MKTGKPGEGNKKQRYFLSNGMTLGASTDSVSTSDLGEEFAADSHELYSSVYKPAYGGHLPVVL